MKKRIVIVIACICAIVLGIFFAKSRIENQKEKCEELIDAYSKQLEDLDSVYITMLGESNMEDKGDINSCGFIIRDAKNDELIVVDGGRDIDSEILMQYINEYGNGKVDHWFITHPHEDHIGALLKLLDEENNLEVENLYYSLLTDEWYATYSVRGYEPEHQILEELSNPKIKNCHQCEKNQIFNLKNFDVEILRIADPEIINSDNGNDSSMTFKFTARNINKSILFLGDSYIYATKELLENPEKLSADLVQMSHHGQNGCSKELYEYVNPQIAFFNAPKWLYDNDTGDGYNTAKYESVTVRTYMEEMGATCLPAYEGDITVKCTS